MRSDRAFSFRSYRDALFDYVVDSRESGLARAYELGRKGIDGGSGLLQVLKIHQEAVNSILESTPAADERARRLIATEEFLMEALSTYEMASRGYLEMLDGRRPKRRRGPHPH